MADTTAKTLLAAAACYQCNAANSYELQMIKLALLKQILLAQNAMADTTPQTLLKQASCYSCYASNAYMLEMIELALLQQIVINGSTGGGGSGGTFGGNGSPVGVVFPTSAFAFYIQADSVPPGLVWEYYNGAWQS